MNAASVSRNFGSSFGTGDLGQRARTFFANEVLFEAPLTSGVRTTGHSFGHRFGHNLPKK
jgi:hypothetical protein